MMADNGTTLVDTRRQRTAPATGEPLLSVGDLKVSFSTRRGSVEAIRGISFDIAAGEALGVVGESGSGKSVTAYAITGLLDRAGRIDGGRIVYRGRDLVGASRATLKRLRGGAISMIFQNPRAALNPIRKVGDQLADVLAAHEGLGRRAALAKAVQLLDQVRINDPAKRMAAYPHELSGGMCQRVMIALALACHPDLLIADEPTTGLDVTTQKTVMDLVATLTRERGMSMMLITHDLGLAAAYCDRIAVMERGLLVEAAPAGALFARPEHPYTRRLVAATPRRTSTLSDLMAVAPDALEAAPADAAGHQAPPTASPATPLLELRGLFKRFGDMNAVDDVSFSLKPGQALGLVGESGSGKTTISRMVCRLLDTTGGEILFDGEDIAGVPADLFHKHPLRRDIQIVFQDPTDSLNPRFTAFDSIVDPLRRLTSQKSGVGLRRRAEELADRVGLPHDLLDRFPHQLSGGQKARVGIARAIAVEPRLLILDEPTAALDVSVQAVVLGLLDRLRRETGLTYLFVSHDLNVVRMLCETVVVLRRGQVVEAGDSATVFERPSHPYTAELIAAIPHFEPDAA
ncbi:ABC transporter ATP-binding protein [Tistrella sp. BH-R2-4]|uniref:ABC transporter ATP-binding protein n=2 Tax=Geminicoccaceae TaxID=2066434 RepID=A0ABU9YQN1_9PROT